MNGILRTSLTHTNQTNAFKTSPNNQKKQNDIATESRIT